MNWSFSPVTLNLKKPSWNGLISEVTFFDKLHWVLFYFQERFRNLFSIPLKPQCIFDLYLFTWTEPNACSVIVSPVVVPVKHYRFSGIDACALFAGTPIPRKGNSTDTDIGPFVLCILSWLYAAFKCTTQRSRAQLVLKLMTDWLSVVTRGVDHPPTSNCVSNFFTKVNISDIEIFLCMRICRDTPLRTVE